MNTEPSITFGPLKIWVHGRQFPDASDYWDGNWLSATARCDGSGSCVEVSGYFLHLGEIQKWKEGLQEFSRLLTGSVELPTIEPTLRVKIEATGSRTGHLKCLVEITGDHMNEHHRFLLDSDQSYLPGLLAQLGTVLREYPIKNEKMG
jgi:hypothetical protein